MSDTGRRPFWLAAGWRLLGIVLLAIVLWRVGVVDLLRVMIGVDPLAVVAGGALATAVLLLKALRWHVLCHGLDIDIPLRESARVYMLGTFVGSITPGRVGDLVKAYYVRDRRERGGLAAGIATVVYDRLLDLGQVSALALGAVVVLPRVPAALGPALVGSGLLAFVAGTVWRPTREGLLARPLNWALRRLPGADGVSPPAPSSTHILIAQMLTLASLVGFAGISVVLARGLSIPTPAWPLAVLSAVGALVGLVPVTVLGVGTRDALYVATAPLLGTSAEAMLALSMLLLAMYLLNTVTGWAAWFLSPPGDRQPPKPS